MDSWLKDIELKSQTISLIPLSRDHRDALVTAASDGELWNLWFTSVPSEQNVDAYLDKALADKAAGLALPFAVIHNETSNIIGSTRYCNAAKANRNVEIGYTWYAKSHQRTSVNTECKLLLLDHAFKKLDAIAVIFRTHSENNPSRKAISRLGAKQDGILRNNMILPDGNYRDTVVFSVLNTEWPEIKKTLEIKLNL